MHGDIGDFFLDHKNGIRNDNRIDNLRLADRSKNGANRPICKSNKTGFKGVSISKKTGKFKAQIKKNGKVFSLGYFSNPESAHEAYKLAAECMHMEFSNTENTISKFSKDKT